MNGHVIVWEWGWAGIVTGRAVCEEPVGASCRTQPECDCETWIELLRDDAGWYHIVEQDEGHGEMVQKVHRHRPSAECNWCIWLNADPSETIMEGRSREDRESFDLGETRIDPVWTGDGVEWKVASDWVPPNRAAARRER